MATTRAAPPPHSPPAWAPTLPHLPTTTCFFMFSCAQTPLPHARLLAHARLRALLAAVAACLPHVACLALFSRCLALPLVTTLRARRADTWWRQPLSDVGTMNSICGRKKGLIQEEELGGKPPALATLRALLVYSATYLARYTELPFAPPKRHLPLRHSLIRGLSLPLCHASAYQHRAGAASCHATPLPHRIAATTAYSPEKEGYNVWRICRINF